MEQIILAILKAFARGVDQGIEDYPSQNPTEKTEKLDPTQAEAYNVGLGLGREIAHKIHV